MEKGRAWFNGIPLDIPQENKECAIAFAQPVSKKDFRGYLSLSMGKHPIRILGLPVLGICLVAMDSLGAYIDLSKPPAISLPELASGKLVLEKSGGKITDADGKPFLDLFACRNRSIIAAKNEYLRKEILERLR